MRAVVITKPGGPEVLAVEDVDDPPRPGGSQVLIRVKAAGLNRADLMQREGKYPPPPGAPRDIPGLEFAGEIEAIGPAVVNRMPGQRVMGLTGGGAQAELLLADEGWTVPAPDTLSWPEAAALPEAFITAHDALFTQLNLQLGESVLIHAAASGVGTAAVQLAHAAGCLVFGTSRTAEKLERVRALGLDEAIAVPRGQPEVFAQRIMDATGGRGVDTVLDLVGAPYFPANLAALAPRGRMICVGLTAGSEARIDLGIILQKRLQIHGTMLRARSSAEKTSAVQEFGRKVLPLLRCGILKPVIERTYPMAEVAEAHRQLERNETFGKLILTI